MRAGELLFLARLLASRRDRRYALRWARTLKPDYLLREAMPWLTFPAIDALELIDLKGKRVFEYGSGGSTAYWLRRDAQCVSVENDAQWYERIRRLLEPSAALDYRFVPPEEGVSATDPADPAAYGSASPEQRTNTFRRYCAQIDAFPDRSFDLVLIDGRARPSCIRHAAPKVREGGWLILDNSDRPYYLERTAADLAGFDRHELPGPVPVSAWLTSTAMFQRRSASRR